MCICMCVYIGFSRFFFSILSSNYLVENEIREELNRVTMIEWNVKLVDVLFWCFLVLREGNFFKGIQVWEIELGVKWRLSDVVL